MLPSRPIVLLVAAGALAIGFAEVMRRDADVRPRMDKPSAALAEAEKRLGDSAWERGQRDQACERYTRALELDGGHLASRYNLGTLLLELKRPREAIHHLTMVLFVKLGNPDVLCNLALAYEAVGERTDALAFLEELVSLHASHAAGHRELGLLLRKSDQFARAREHLERALGLGDRDVELLTALAKLDLGFGARDAAIARLKLALDQKLGDPELLNLLGMSLVEAGDYSRACDVLGRVTGEGPPAATARFWTGRALRRLGRLEDAHVAIQEAIRLGFTAPTKSYPLHAYLELGLVLLQQKKPVTALPHLKIAAGQGISLARAFEAEPGVFPTTNVAPPGRNDDESATSEIGRLVAAPGAPAARARAAASIRLSEESEARGVRFAHRTDFPLWYLPQTFGPGVAFFDHDGDGSPDLYFAGSGEGTPPQAGALFRNRGGGVFDAANVPAGLHETGRGLGVTACDLDNDGYADLILTGYRQLVIAWNNGDGTFQRADLAAPNRTRFFTGSCVLDYDKDGWPDLYIGAYSAWDAGRPETAPEILTERDGTRYLSTLRAQTYPAEPDLLLRNLGGRRFSDVTRASGIADSEGRTLGVVAFDSNADGWPDIYTANDTTANNLWVNHSGRFADEASRRWVNDARGAMGLAVGDVFSQGLLDVFVTNWAYEANAFFRAGRKGYRDVAAPLGLAEPSFPNAGWGAAFPDLDNDGRLDLMYVQGHTTAGDYQTADYRTSRSHLIAQPVMAFLGSERGRMEEATAAWGLAGQVVNGRGLAVGDIDSDGWLDVVVGVNNGPARVYRNSGGSLGRICLELVGTRSARSAVGTQVWLGAPDGRLFELSAGGSYLSCHEAVIHAGLGGRSAIDQSRIRWPSGDVRVTGKLSAGRKYRMVEPW